MGGTPRFVRTGLAVLALLGFTLALAGCPASTGDAAKTSEVTKPAADPKPAQDPKPAGDSKAPPKSKPAVGTLDPAYADYQVRSVAMLTLANTTGTNAATPLVTGMIERDLKLAARHLYFDWTQTGSEASRRSAGDEYNRLVASWQKGRTLSAEQLASFGQKLGVQAVLVGELSKWESKKIPFDQEGTSNTDVTISLTLYATSDGKQLWTSKESKSAKSVYYTPGDQNVKYDATGRAQSNTSKLAPDPPPVEEVAKKVVAALTAAVPK